MTRDSEVSGTLDLSMKKTRSPEYANNHKLVGPLSLSAHGGGIGLPGNNNKGGPSSHGVPMIAMPPHQSSVHLYKQHPSVSSHESPNNNFYHSSAQVRRLIFLATRVKEFGIQPFLTFPTVG